MHEGGQSWSEIGVLVRDNQHAADVFDASYLPPKEERMLP